MSQHAELTAERWARSTLGQQILQIGVELHRGESALRPERMRELRNGHERLLRPIDLTVQVNSGLSLRREWLRLREVIGELYLREEPDSVQHRAASIVTLQLHPDSAPQVEYLDL